MKFDFEELKKLFCNYNFWFIAIMIIGFVILICNVGEYDKGHDDMDFLNKSKFYRLH